jgi:mono/diheme cytochrome c family protein
MRWFLLIFALVIAAVVGIAGCRGSKSRKPVLYIFPDMDRQPKVLPQEFNAFFADNFSSREPVPGAIPQSKPFKVGSREVYRFEDLPVNTGRATGTTNFIENNPFPVTAELLERGRSQFNLICAACHSQAGDGKGVPNRIGAMAVVGNLHDKRIVELADGEIFSTLSYGKSLMQGYAASIPVPDRWAIVAYVRALQLSWLGSLDDVPEPARAVLSPK